MTGGGAGTPGTGAPLSARATVGRAFALLGSRPGVLVAGLVAAAGGALALEAATSAFARTFHDHAGAAIGLWLLGGTVGAFLGAAALVAIVAAPSGEGALGRVPASLKRGVGALSLWALERFLQATLLVGALVLFLAALGRVTEPTPRQIAIAATAALAPTLVPLGLSVLAFRVAIAATARGLPTWLALAEGFRVALTRFGLLVRVLVLVGVGSLPAVAGEAALTKVLAAHPAPAAAVVAIALRGMLAVAAAAWSYAAVLLASEPLSPLSEAPSEAPVA